MPLFLHVLTPSNTAPTISTTSEAPSTGTTSVGTTTTLPNAVVFLEATLDRPFEPELEDQGSAEYQNLEARVISVVSQHFIISALFSRHIIWCFFGNC